MDDDNRYINIPFDVNDNEDNNDDAGNDGDDDNNADADVDNNDVEDDKGSHEKCCVCVVSRIS